MKITSGDSHLQPWAQQRYEATEWALDDAGKPDFLLTNLMTAAGRTIDFRPDGPQ